ncbi:MAG TPA: VOC family protein [Nevskiaceae bacterium]
MFEFEGIDHITLRVHDMPAMLAFYRDTLGCTLEKEEKERGLYLLRAGSGLVALHQAEGSSLPQTRSRLDHLCLRLAHFDAEKIREQLMAKGVACGRAVTRDGAMGPSEVFYVHDPEGNVVELKAPTSAAQPAGSERRAA